MRFNNEFYDTLWKFFEKHVAVHASIFDVFTARSVFFFCRRRMKFTVDQNDLIIPVV